MRQFSALILVSLVAVFLSFSAQAASQLDAEIDTAHQHAGLAQGASDVDAVHMHLHHVINCLVGEQGDAFDADEANPCQGKGNGAIPDASDSELKGQLNKALKQAQSGLDTDDLKKAQSKAGQVSDTLKNAQ